jgi:ABC-2 type transport system permease protein
MTDAATTLATVRRPDGRKHGARYLLRILGVTAAADYKLKYSGSVLGYLWSVMKPLLLFTMLYFVFGHIFKLTRESAYYPQSLLMGIVCFFFFADATTLSMISLVSKESLLRKLIFPRIVIPASAVLTATITFLVNLVVVAAFVAYAGIPPRLSWLWIVPLLLELFVFILGISLILATLFVRLRDISQLWELAVQLFFYASVIMYPIGYLPPWAQRVVFVNPFVQILQDTRSVILYRDIPSNRLTVTHAFGAYGRLIPLGVAALILLVGLALFKREEPWIAERV